MKNKFLDQNKNYHEFKVSHAFFSCFNLKFNFILLEHKMMQLEGKKIKIKKKDRRFDVHMKSDSLCTKIFIPNLLYFMVCTTFI